ncbi:hypothetical protein BDY17DRAFT_326139 [Neohortaea acidophila]|uniref:Uncharacterized protein n=1 Tax=Neohortaea acidophila TaxID=245834 RepID=A0A6A6PP33_9PEZI|nr:uncharacterized protein BDY17DRAFT_326139 [Neohortaea acidophila]KAF2481451.1 hypothetical protein BDY17DRAFT_326139 [Neohortaea acidophila]
MKLFALLPVAFCLAANALPGKHASHASTAKTIKKNLATNNLTPSDPISDLLNAFDLSGSSEISGLIDGLTGGSSSVLSEVESIIEGVLGELGLLGGLLGGLGGSESGNLTATIDQIESELGLNANSTISSLLSGLQLP